MPISKLSTLLLICALTLAACGGEATGSSESTAQTDDTTSTSIDANEAVTAYTQCMRDNGIDIEDPTTDADGNLIPGSLGDAPQPGGNATPGQGPGAGLDEDTQAALEDCNQLLEGTGLGFGGPPGGGDPEELQQQFAELTTCLAEQGLDVDQPDTTVGEGQPGGPFGGLGNLDFNDPDVQAAMEECGEFVPDFGGQGGPGGFDDQGGDDG